MSDDNTPADLTDVYNILVDLHDIMAELLALSKSKRQTPAATVAPEVDLDGQYGNPKVRFLPKDWTGDDYRQRPFSDCPSEFLDLMAKAYDYFAGKDEQSNALTTGGKPKAPYTRLDAARARGWAARNRNKPVAAKEFEATPWAEGEGPRW